MIINPSAHTMIPRRNSFRNRAFNGRRRAISIPGGKQLWLRAARILFASVTVIFICSFLLNASGARVNAEIEKAQISYNELMEANSLLRAEEVHLFSPETIGALAASKLAMQFPVPGQYREF